MAQAIPVPPPGFDQLSQDEKLSYIEMLLERIEDEPIRLSDEQVALLRSRRERHRAHPEEALPWEEVKASLLAEFE